MSFRHDHAGCGRAHAHHGSEAQSYAARPFAFGTSPRNFERDRPFAIEHLALDLELDFAKRSVVGSAALTIRRVDPDAHRIDLDGVGFTVASVQLDGKSVEYTYDGRVLGAELPKGLSRGVLVITYRATLAPCPEGTQLGVYAEVLFKDKIDELLKRPGGLLRASPTDPELQGIHERSVDALVKRIEALSAVPYR